MAIIFPRWTNFLPLILGLVAPLGLGVAVGGIWYYFSPSFTDVGYAPEQPVPFSHRLHAGELGVDCRYCHYSVEEAPHAAIPDAATCMNCHRFIEADHPDLQPVRDAYAGGKPLKWVRVHMLPDYAFFDHSVHLAAGVGCSSCHGRIDQMDVVQQVEPLSMSWCLDCHRNPQPHMRPRDKDLVTKMDYVPGGEVCNPHTDPRRECEFAPPEHCSGCHR